MDLAKYEKIFASESGKYLKELEDLLIQVEKNLSDLDLWAEIHGKVHSIKGMARALSLNKISDLCHLIEEWCIKFQQGKIKSSPAAVQMLFESSEFLGTLISKSGRLDTIEDQKSFDNLMAMFQKNPPELSETIQVPPPSPSSAQTQPMIKSIDYVRIRYTFIEELLGLTQEIQLLAKRFPSFSTDQMSSGLKNWVDHYTSLMKVLYFQLTKLRLMPVGDFADMFRTSIRNMAKENGKNIDFEIIGGEIQADITLLERLREPLIHIFRNCIAHGIESAEERISKGKNAAGKITIEARSEKENLYIKIRDDGRGINKALIIKHLKEKRNISDEEIKNMSEEDICDTILSPDFTSSQGTTDLSGRGIGMSVVAQSVDYLGGSLTISSKKDIETELSIKLPLSLSIIYAIIFSVGRYILAIPTLNINSIDRIDLSFADDTGSYYDTRKLMGVTCKNSSYATVLSLRYTADNGGLADVKSGMKLIVDNVIGNRPLMVLPMGGLLSRIKLFSGIGIMENGDIAILLDADNLP
jgi:two-component system chemotaxis sensor kinase CheA